MKPLNFGGEDMFVIVTYDVHQKRCGRVMKYLREWLEHRQRSVFSGYLSIAQIRAMEHGLRKITDPDYDSIIIFQMNRADQITESCTRIAKETRITSMIVMPEEQRRKIAKMRAKKFKRMQNGEAGNRQGTGSMGFRNARSRRGKDSSEWRFRF